MQSKTLTTISALQLNNVTGGNSFRNLTTKQAVNRLQRCSELVAANPAAIAYGTDGWEKRSHDFCTKGVEAVEKQERQVVPD